jgi:hypothetical protein
MKPIEPTNRSHAITDAELQPFLGNDSPQLFANRIFALIKQQFATWSELRQAREYLKQALTKKIMLSDTEIQLQHNPYRMKSSSSRVDKKSIEARPCFLCPDNLFPKQKGLLYKDEWLILNNPFPIFIDHLVVTHRKHDPQDMVLILGAMISFIEDSGFCFTVLYNGPACGASAPDHLHFQAGPDGGLPITGQIKKLIGSSASGPSLKVVDKNKTGTCFTGTFNSRTLFVCITEDSELLSARLKSVLNFLKDTAEAAEEPMVNLIISGMGGGYLGILFPRQAHRPACFYKDGSQRMLVSPGAVDLGGLVILPRREDYERMTGEQIGNVFSEVCCGPEIFKGLCF